MDARWGLVLLTSLAAVALTAGECPECRLPEDCGGRFYACTAGRCELVGNPVPGNQLQDGEDEGECGECAANGDCDKYICTQSDVDFEIDQECVDVDEAGLADGGCLMCQPEVVCPTEVDGGG